MTQLLISAGCLLLFLLTCFALERGRRKTRRLYSDWEASGDPLAMTGPYTPPGGATASEFQDKTSSPMSQRTWSDTDRTAHETVQQLTQLNSWLAESHDHLMAVINEARVGIVIVDKDGRIVFLSKAAEQLFDHVQALGKFWQELFPVDDPVKERLKESMTPPGPGHVQFPIQWRSCDQRRFRMEIEIIRHPQDPSNHIMYFHDASEVADLDVRGDEEVQFKGLHGKSERMQSVYRQIRAVARGDATVLIEGETGAGKELVARAIHFSSPRHWKPFLAINCAGLSESLLGSQLFGHRRGAFTGAVADQLGLFEAANGGTLFLDEIGDIPPSIQSSLLRVLQEKEITRLGETHPRAVDVRIVAATHHDLKAEVARGSFREDLLYRIRVATIEVPPLRERVEDLPALVADFLDQACRSNNMPAPEIAAETMRVLKTHRWPGNVRELKSAIESALLQSDGKIIRVSDLPDEVSQPSEKNRSFNHQDEKARIQAALDRTHGNKSEAARLLGISRATFYRMLTRLQIPAKTAGRDASDTALEHD